MEGRRQGEVFADIVLSLFVAELLLWSRKKNEPQEFSSSPEKDRSEEILLFFFLHLVFVQS